MLFYVGHSPPTSPEDFPYAWLVPDNWDDHFEFQTTFVLNIVDHRDRHTIGFVKIGHAGLLGSSSRGEHIRTPSLPQSPFKELPNHFFSLGEGEDYYLQLNQFGTDILFEVLSGLKDCAQDLPRFEKFFHEPSMQMSLLRSVTPSTVSTKLHALTDGAVILTDIHFSHSISLGDNTPRLLLDFHSTPLSNPPTNMHVLIGKNGVGKTTWIKSLARSVIEKQNIDLWYDSIDTTSSVTFGEQFSGLVLVSFSAFDAFADLATPSGTLAVHFVGLEQRQPDRPVQAPSAAFASNSEHLAHQFGLSMTRCRLPPKRDRWRAVVGSLSHDDLLAETGIQSLFDDFVWDGSDSEDTLMESCKVIFSRLSSGHAAVVLALTRLVETVGEKTLVLIDEPESHLHPPLLAAFMRSVSELLSQRNGIAVVATHSPVVLQEVPKSCVWKLHRSGLSISAIRPDTETFGENVGILTREAFGLEVTRSGFYQIIAKLVAEGLSADQVLEHFEGQLGFEARAITQALVAERDIEV